MTAPVAIGTGTAANAAVEIASLPHSPGPTLGDLTQIIQQNLDQALAESEQHRQKLVALIRTVIARPEMFAKDPSARASVERFLDESEARWGKPAGGA